MVLAFFEARGRTTLPELRLKTTHTLTPDNFVHAGVKPLAILSIALHPQKQLHKSIISTIDVKHLQIWSTLAGNGELVEALGQSEK